MDGKELGREEWMGKGWREEGRDDGKESREK